MTEERKVKEARQRLLYAKMVGEAGQRFRIVSRFPTKLNTAEDTDVEPSETLFLERLP